MRNLFRFPKEDPLQAMRAGHTVMAMGAYLTIGSFVLYCSHAGLFRLPPIVTTGFIVLAIASSTFFYLAICMGWNKHLHDPSMMLPQMIVGTLWIMFLLYFTEHIRGALLMLLLNNLIFGIFRLRTRQFVGVAILGLAGYAAVIALLATHRPQSIDLQVEMLQWVLLLMVLPWFAIIGAYISNIRSVLRQKNKDMEKALETIEQLASHDELTGIYSRRFFLDALHHEKNRSERDHQRFCLAMLDLDLFKIVNDTHGHPVGDEVLRAFAECVQIEVRQADYFARYGGEEFSLLLVDTDLDLASEILERIRQRVESHSFPHVGKTITVSAGIAEYRPGEDLIDMIGRADRALYAAKKANRNRVEIAMA